MNPNHCLLGKTSVIKEMQNHRWHFFASTVSNLVKMLTVVEILKLLYLKDGSDYLNVSNNSRNAETAVSDDWPVNKKRSDSILLDKSVSDRLCTYWEFSP